MTGEERKIYDLVIKRFLAALYPPAEFEEIKITAVIEGETFTAKGRKVLKEGWR